MAWYGRRSRSIGELSSAGALGGLVLLLFCVIVPVRQEARAEVRTAAGRDEPPAGLLFPVPAVSPPAMANSFNDRRGERTHQAVDIMAPRHSDVVAVADGTVARLMTSEAGGIAVYQWSAAGGLVFYYAHLQGYAPNLHQGQKVKRGEVLGYVGTTGNAPPGTPHLHFAISRVGKEGHWWGGAPIDPYPVFLP